jgi:hypothetical protein
MPGTVDLAPVWAVLGVAAGAFAVAVAAGLVAWRRMSFDSSVARACRELSRRSR